MNIQIVELIQEANKIISVTGSGPGTKYPKSLKTIVVELIVDHKVPAKELIKHIPISEFSARQWPKKIEQEKSFNKVLVSQSDKKATERSTKKVTVDKKIFHELSLINFNLNVLITLQVVLLLELLVLHLF